MKLQSNLARLLSTAAMLACAWNAHAGPLIVEYADGDFGSGWDTVNVSSNDLLTLTTERVETGGNPGAYERHSMQAQRIPGGVSDVSVADFRFNTAFTWDLNSQGAISSIEFAFDTITLSTSFLNNVGLSYRGAVRQGDSILFQPDDGSGFSSTLDWAARTSSFDVGLLDLNAGGMLEFGFVVGISLRCDVAADAFCNAVSSSAGIDNFAVRITGSDASVSVPEPGALGLLSLGLLGMVTWRRRRPR